MKYILTILFIFNFSLCYSQKNEKEVKKLCFEVINDLIHSTDFTPQKLKLEKQKADTELIRILHRKYPDFVDTTIYKKFRISFLGTQMDEICILNFRKQKYLTKEKLNEIENNFDSNDLVFMKSQLLSINNFRWNKKLIGVKIIKDRKVSRLFKKYNNDKAWEIVHKRYCKTYYNFSKPIFNKSYTKGVIYIDMHCGGLCGHGGTYIIEKKNGVWNIVSSFGIQWWS